MEHTIKTTKADPSGYFVIRSTDNMVFLVDRVWGGTEWKIFEVDTDGNTEWCDTVDTLKEAKRLIIRGFYSHLK